MVAQFDRADTEGFNGAHVAAALDIFSDPKSIIGHVEDAADDVPDQRLRAEADRDAENARTRDQWTDRHAKAGQHHQDSKGGDEHSEEIAQDRQQRHQPSAAGECSFIAAFDAGAFDALVDEALDHVPDQIRCEQNDDAAQYATDHAAGSLVLHQSACAQANDCGEPNDCKRDDDHPCAPLDEHFKYGIPGLWRIIRAGEERLHDCAGRSQDRWEDQGVYADPQSKAHAGNP